MKKIRCAIYTRKSSEDGLEQEFNSLHAQREACGAYVASQKHEGWVLLPEAYDDGGLSGGSLERPALKRLLEGMRAGLVDQIVVYKIDRLTRSLADFAKIVDTLDAANASFVSVTQAFNTATSMGRLTLNMLLSFAQFEREVTAERIRDKIAASKRKGLWMGGLVPLGYDASGRTLAINDAEAAIIRTLYELYERFGTVREVKAAADDLGLRSKVRIAGDGRTRGGRPFERGHIHHILSNPLYSGRIRHRDKVFDGQHPAIITPDRWRAVQERLQEGAAKGRSKTMARQTSLLCRKLFDETGDRLIPSHTKTARGVRLRYYISHRLVARSGEAAPDGWRLPAEQLERCVIRLVKGVLSQPALASHLSEVANAGEIGRLRRDLEQMATGADDRGLTDLLTRIDIAPGEIGLSLDPGRLGKALEIDAHQIDPTSLRTTARFQLRKRGVETKLVLADMPTGRDETLIRNIAMAHSWFEQIKAGKTFAEIAGTASISKRRIQQMIDMAFLAPDILRDVLDGTQPLGFTSDWCLRHEIPADWQNQRRLISTL